MDIRKW